MYKSKLQVFCQKNSWDLPDYTTVKDGPDHNPKFSATVIVNGFPFQTAEDSRTAKEAQNKVAKIAFDTLSAPVPSLNPPQPSRAPAGPGTPIQPFYGFPELTMTGVPPAPQPSMTEIPAPQPSMTEIPAPPLQHDTSMGVKDDKKPIDARHLYKNRLQSFAQKKNLKIPEYSCVREGPSHASRFRCNVTIDGKTYEGSEFFNTIKEAEHAAAKLAWDSLAANEIQQEDSGLYKNLLQELAQKRGFRIPLYETAVSGPPHMPTFVSTVNVGGNSFQGEAAKSKKQAEMTAAKVAFNGLVNGLGSKDGERTVSNEPRVTRQSDENMTLTVFPSGDAITEALARSSTALQSVINSESNQNVGANSSTIAEEEGKNHIGGNVGKFPSQPTTEKAEVGMPRPSLPPEEADENAKRHRYSPPSNNAYEVSESVASPSTSFNGSVESRNEQRAGGSSSRNFEKIYVVPRHPNMTIPEGADVFPFSDEKWVAYKIRPTQS